MEIAVLEGYGRGGRKAHMARRRRGGKRSLRKKMKSCAKRHKVTSRSFWACVRKGRKSRR